jgi:WD40 repeat protein
MLAFAAARLWECRDRDRGLVTREAYEHIGGVGGALARHAERTLESLGAAAVPIVRELFRNLVTGDGTRASRSRDELLSVFPPPNEGRDAAADPVGVLDALVDARLLTTYEIEAESEDESPQQLVEIIHESLLSSWPRLVRWQAQDREGLLLRDQLRQAARMWEDRGRPEDLLWTGTSFREYSLWRERYSGGLSTDEEEFAHAMTVHAGRRRRRRRAVRAAVVTALLVGLAVVGSLWRQAERETRRSEANNLLAWGRLLASDDPTAALAFALASLERTDTAEGRRLALEALWREPPARFLEGTPRLEGSPMVFSHAVSVDFSPDGRWLAAGYYQRGAIRLWPRSGGHPVELRVADGNTAHVRFGPGAGVMTTRSYPDHSVQMWSVPELEPLRTLPVAGPLDFRMAADAERVFTFSRYDDSVRVKSWSLEEVAPVNHPDLAGRLYEWAKYANPWIPEVAPAGELIAYAPYGRGSAAHSVAPEVYVVETAADSVPRPVGTHPKPIGGLAFHPDGRLVASVDDTSEVRIWDADAPEPVATRVLHHSPGLVRELRFDPTGSKLSAVSFSGHTSVWDLEGPPDAAPLYLHRDESAWSQAIAFDPTGRWHATSGNLHIAIRPITRRYATELLGHSEEVTDVAFLPDGGHLVSASKDGTVRLWPLAAHDGTARVVYDGGVWLDSIEVDPSGRRCLIVTVTGSVSLVPLDGEHASRRLGHFDTRDIQLALSDGLAVASGGHTNLKRAIRVWDLKTGEVRTYPTGAAPFSDMHLTPDNRLVTSGEDGIHVWNLDDGSARLLSESPSRLSLTSDGRRLLAGWQGDDDTAVVHDLEAGTTVDLVDRGPCEYGRLDAAGDIAATQPLDGFSIQVGRVDGGPLHLVADQHGLHEFELSPDARWIAAVRLGSPNIELWPVPDLSRPPLYSLPHDQLLERLRTLTNLRVVEHPEAPDLWAYDLEPFPGWETVPEW